MSDQDFSLNLVAGSTRVAVVAQRDRDRSEQVDIEMGLLQDILNLAALDEREAGQLLYQAVFQKGIRELYGKCLDLETSRVIVELPKPLDPRSRLLHDLPWESLHDGAEYLAARERSPVIRRIGVASSRLVKPEWPLRILLTTANPPGSPRLNLEREEEEIRVALREFGSNAVLTVLRDITFEALQDEYRKASDRGAGFYIWHHCGHGILGEREDLPGMRDFRRPLPPPSETSFELLLQGSGDKGEAVDGEDIGRLIADNRSLGLVVLNVCLGASPTGLAPRLASLAVGNTVAFSRPVADGHAIRFASTFYRNLAAASLEKVVVRCRQSVSGVLGNLVHYSRTEESWRLGKPPAPASAADLAHRSAVGGLSQMSKLQIGNATETFLIRGGSGLVFDFAAVKGEDDGA